MLFDEAERLGQVDVGVGAKGGSDGAEGEVVLGDGDALGSEVELLGEEAADGGVERDAADEEDAVLEILAAGDGGAVVPTDGLVDAGGDALPRGALLIEVDDIGFGEDGAATGESGGPFGFVGFDGFEIPG